jgi:hypothetical protein
MQLQDASPQQCRLRPDAAVRVRFNEIDEENAEGLLAVVCGVWWCGGAHRSASAQSQSLSLCAKRRKQITGDLD